MRILQKNDTIKRKNCVKKRGIGMLTFAKLNQDTVDAYLEYLKRAMAQEPHLMMAETFDEAGIRQRIRDPFYQKTTSILAIEDGAVIGRIEFHFYGCMQDGYRMAYVDWVYVLPRHRHRGVAQGLFRELEKDCAAMGIDQYYLIRSERAEADRFYRAFEKAELSTAPLLRKYLSE